MEEEENDSDGETMDELDPKEVKEFNILSKGVSILPPSSSTLRTTTNQGGNFCTDLYRKSVQVEGT